MRNDVEGFLDDWFKSGSYLHKSPSRGYSNRTKRIAVAGGRPRHAIFRLISKGRTNRSLGNLTRYLTGKGREHDDTEKDRKFKRQVWTESGIIDNEEDLQKLTESWYSDFQRHKRKNSLKFIHVSISTPAGSDRDATHKAALSFVQKNFAGHRFMAVRHDDTKNPHCHLVIQNHGTDNKPLKLRKAALLNYRASWAESARAQQINVHAIERKETGNRNAGQKMASIKAQQRGEKSHTIETREQVHDPIIVRRQLDSIVETSIIYYKESQQDGSESDNDKLKQHAEKLFNVAQRLALDTLSNKHWQHHLTRYKKQFGEQTINQLLHEHPERAHQKSRQY